MPNSRDPYVDFFLAADRAVAEIQTLEIRQVSFSRVWRLQFHYRNGLTAALETGAIAEFQYVPMSIQPLEDRGTLDFGLGVTLGDLGDILPDEIERARAAETLRTHPPQVIYRVYRSDDLSRPMLGPVDLEAREIGRTRDGAKFNATAPELNVTKTGEPYTTDRFPMLLGVL